MPNLWPEFSVDEPTIKDHIIEAGKGINQRTKGKVLFEVETRLNGSEFRQNCALRSIISNFKYPLFFVVHPSEDFPAKVYFDGFRGTLGYRLVSNLEELTEALADIFNNSSTQSVVRQLIASGS